VAQHLLDVPVADGVLQLEQRRANPGQRSAARPGQRRQVRQRRRVRQRARTAARPRGHRQPSLLRLPGAGRLALRHRSGLDLVPGGRVELAAGPGVHGILLNPRGDEGVTKLEGQGRSSTDNFPLARARAQYAQTIDAVSRATGGRL